MKNNIIKKGGIALGITGTTLISLAAPAQAAFTDVPTSSAYYKSTDWMDDNHIVNPAGDGSFKYTEAITKGDFLKFLTGTYRTDVSAKWWAPFKDVAENSSYRQTIAWAYNEGLITASSDGTIGVNNKITKAEAINMIYKMHGSPSVKGIPQQFNDVRPTHPQYNAIQWGKKNGIIWGNSSKNFRPFAQLTRGEASLIMQNASNNVVALGQGDLLKTIVENAKIDVSKNWWSPFTDVPEDSMYRQVTAYALKKEAITAKSDGSLGIYDRVSKGKLAVILYKMSGSPEVTSTRNISDVSSKSSNYDAIQWVVSKGILGVNSDGKFKPGSAVGKSVAASAATKAESYIKSADTPLKPAPTPTPTPTPTPVKDDTYTVLAGQGWWQISSATGVSVDDLLKFNDKKITDETYPGMVVRLTAPVVSAPKPTPDPGPILEDSEEPVLLPTYIVKAGDGLWKISRETGVSVADLQKFNKLTSTSILMPGQVLVLRQPPADYVPPNPTGDQGNVPDFFLDRTYDPATLAAAEKSYLIFQNMTVPSKEQIRQMVYDEAIRQGVDPYLAIGHAYTESNFKHNSVSPSNALGTMQVIPSTGKWIGDMNNRKVDLYQAKDNIFAGVWLIKWLHAHEKNYDYAIGGYYEGLSSVQKNGPRADTVTYINTVKKYAEMAKQGKI